MGLPDQVLSFAKLHLGGGKCQQDSASGLPGKGNDKKEKEPSEGIWEGAYRKGTRVSVSSIQPCTVALVWAELNRNFLVLSFSGSHKVFFF